MRGVVVVVAIALLSVARAQERDARLEEALRLDARVVQLFEGGRAAEAVALARRSLALREQALGSGHVEVAASLNNLAGIHWALGAYGEARPLFERALAIRERALGPDSLEVAATLSNLGAVHYALGELDKARPIFERALPLQERVLGPEHVDLTATLSNLATLLQGQGACAAAQPLLERALRILERDRGPEHPDVATILVNLAAIHRTQGAHARARELLLRALATTERTLGPDHPDLGTLLGNLGAVLWDLGAYDEARPLHERALAIQERALGPDHPAVARSLNNLAMLHQTVGSHAEARRLHERGFVRLDLPTALEARGDRRLVGWDPLLLSGLALSGANAGRGGGDDDGILSAAEVAELDLAAAELVVLSACDSAGGSRQAGEGVLGLLSAFRQAGARNVVASLWAVDDEATRALMERFYARVSDVPPAVALREAARALRALEVEAEVVDPDASLLEGREVRRRARTRPFAAPRHWAAFVACGGAP